MHKKKKKRLNFVLCWTVSLFSLLAACLLLTLRKICISKKYENVFFLIIFVGDPSPNVTWWRGSTLIDDDFNVTTDGFVRNELYLYKIQRIDLLEEFTCRAENTLLTEPKDATLKVDINCEYLKHFSIFIEHFYIFLNKEMYHIYKNSISC